MNKIINEYKKLSDLENVVLWNIISDSLNNREWGSDMPIQSDKNYNLNQQKGALGSLVKKGLVWATAEESPDGFPYYQTVFVSYNDEEATLEKQFERVA